MATNLDLDDALIEEAKRLGKHRTKKAAVQAALKAYVNQIKQQKILKLAGQIEYDSKYNYKKERSRS